ncbi:hypothetical protein [Streptomyces sp. NPDC057403]|uniref:hypothetical protein n=1 Tax=Streptomyces sp. NPDC057403 TaxID=3346119 RepID=UPI003683B857
MPDTPPEDDHGVHRRLAAVFGALTDASPDQAADTAQLAEEIRQALRLLGGSVGPTSPVGQAESAGCAVLVTAVPTAGHNSGYDVTLTAAWPDAGPDALAGAVLSLAIDGRTYWLTRLGIEGEAEWKGVPKGPWRFDLVAAAAPPRRSAVTGGMRYPLPVERASLAPAAQQQEEPRVMRFSDADAELSLFPARHGDQGGRRVDLRVLKPGGRPVAYPLHYREHGGAAAVVLVAVENRPYRSRASVTLRSLDTSEAWGLGDPVGPEGIQEYPPEVVAASLRAVGDNVETADAWRAIAGLAGGWLAELIASEL